MKPQQLQLEFILIKKKAMKIEGNKVHWVMEMDYCIVFTMSSIFKILRTVSEARVIALIETRRG